MARMITLRSSDNEVFEVEEAVAMESQTIKHMIEDECVDNDIPLPNVSSSSGVEAVPVEDDVAVDVIEEIEPPSAAVPFSRLFSYVDELDWVLMVVGAILPCPRGVALVVYLYFFGRVINLLDSHSEALFGKIKQQSEIEAFQANLIAQKLQLENKKAKLKGYLTGK
ncbi:hypothetical protein ZIOFF_040035 [Zingiber officinale]|uniref:SKP1 component POZ domain-containing protein n=1 Tax=Zingiber officinale TaxID=94328 RepID=A0A8J5G379_ZINOF|nr:hypothetical protein ZIOFF_040035 [Zingiber officinale]